MIQQFRFGTAFQTSSTRLPVGATPGGRGKQAALGGAQLAHKFLGLKPKPGIRGALDRACSGSIAAGRLAPDPLRGSLSRHPRADLQPGNLFSWFEAHFDFGSHLDRVSALE